MEIFTKEHKIFILIDHNINLLPVLYRFGINLGFKDKKVKTVCGENNINPDFLLAIVNTYNNEDYFPEQELVSFSPLEIISYLKKTHQYYLNYMVPQLDLLMNRLIESSRSESQGLQMLKVFYQKYKNELLLHIDDEEQRIFPYVEKLVRNQIKKSDYSILSFEEEHTNVDEKLNDLKNLIIKYIEPDYDQNICNEFLMTLFRFQKDLNDHARIEDTILLHQAEALEKKIRS